MTATRLYTKTGESLAVLQYCSAEPVHMYTLETANNRVSILAAWTGGEDSPPIHFFAFGYQ